MVPSNFFLETSSVSLSTISPFVVNNEWLNRIALVENIILAANNDRPTWPMPNLFISVRSSMKSASRFLNNGNNWYNCSNRGSSSGILK